MEDDKVNQSLLVAALSRRGFSAFVANNGDEAVRLASRDSFDAILMDIQMPERDGFEATRRIRSLRGRVATIPIIALTGLKGPVVRKRCTEVGFTAVLEKPINLDRLGSTLRRWLPGAARRHRRSVHRRPNEWPPRRVRRTMPPMSRRCSSRKWSPSSAWSARVPASPISSPMRPRAACGSANCCLDGKSERDRAELRGDQRPGGNLRRDRAWRSAGGDRRRGHAQ